jgi:hypothetical protein
VIGAGTITAIGAGGGGGATTTITTIGAGGGGGATTRAVEQQMTGMLLLND